MSVRRCLFVCAHVHFVAVCVQEVADEWDLFKFVAEVPTEANARVFDPTVFGCSLEAAQV